jgi:hypothetical protein
VLSIWSSEGKFSILFNFRNRYSFVSFFPRDPVSLTYSLL